MLSESKKQVASEADTTVVKEVAAPQSLHIKEVTVTSEFDNQGTHVKVLEQQAKTSINRVFFINLAIALLYAICYFFVFNGEFKIFEILYDVTNNDMPMRELIL